MLTITQQYILTRGHMLDTWKHKQLRWEYRKGKLSENRDFEKGCKVVGHMLQVTRKNKIDGDGGKPLSRKRTTNGDKIL